MTAHHRLRAAAIAAALCTTPFLAMPAATAAGPYTLTVFQSDDSSGSAIGNCTQTGSTHSATAGQPLTANAAPKTATAAVSYSVESADDTTDTVASNASITVKGSVKGSGSNPTAMDIGMSAHASTTASKPASACTVKLTPDYYVAANFTLTHPTVLTTDAMGRGIGGYAWQVLPGTTLSGFDINPGQSQGASLGQSPRSHSSVFLTPGTYTALVAVLASVHDNKTANHSGTASLHLAFAAAGSRTAVHQSAYVTMPVARTCSTHRVAPRITTNAKKAKQIKSVAFRVNGKLVKTVKNPHKGTTFKLAATDDQDATVTAKAKLRNGRTVTSTASYRECQ